MGNTGSAGESMGCEGRGKRIAIVTFGCQMNVRDSEVICGLLRAMSYELTAEPKEADVIIFNTCSVRQHAEDKVWSEVGRIAKLGTGYRVQGTEHKKHGTRYTVRSTKKIIGIVGCMAKNYKEWIFERAPAVDFVVGPSDIHKIPEILKKLNTRYPILDTQELKIWETDGESRPEEIYHTGFYEDKEHAYVVISEGCSNFCSYCVVPYVRGPLKNRNYKDILEEIEEAIDKGITKITLLGQNVCAYGAENREQKNTCLPAGRENIEKISFIKLLELVNQIGALKEFSFITSHPKDTALDLFKAMADLDKLKKYLHLPVQSGSDRILALMNRGYTRKFYLDLAENYRKIVKNAVLTTDIIVGFPTEKEEDFQDTYNLVEDIGFGSAYIFKYSPRPHTEAQKLADDVEKKEKERRHKIILDLQKETSNKRKAQN